MKLSKKTIDAFKYISAIYPSILVRQGSVLRSRSASKNALTKVIIDDEFPMDFVIYDIKGFLKVLDLFTEPNVEFVGDMNSGYMEITEGNAKVRYRFSAPELHTNVPENQDFTPQNVRWDMTTQLTASQISNILSAARVMSLDVVSFTKDKIKLSNANEKAFTNFELTYDNMPVVSIDAPEDFYINFSTSNLNLYTDSDYNVEFFCGNQSGMKLIKVDGTVVLWLAALPSSKV